VCEVITDPSVDAVLPTVMDVQDAASGAQPAAARERHTQAIDRVVGFTVLDPPTREHTPTEAETVPGETFLTFFF